MNAFALDDCDFFSSWLMCFFSDINQKDKFKMQKHFCLECIKFQRYGELIEKSMSY